MNIFCCRKEKFTILWKSFPAQRVETLEQFLERTQPNFFVIYNNRDLKAENDEELDKLLKKCIVITSSNAPLVPSLSFPQSTQQEVVQNAIISLNTSSKQRGLPTDLLGLGCVVHYGRKIDIQYPNTIVNFVLSKPWEKLLFLIGDEVMFYLLRHTVLLFELPNDCFMQLTGTPLRPPINKKFRKYFVEPSRQRLPPSVRRLIPRLIGPYKQLSLLDNNNHQQKSQHSLLSKARTTEHTVSSHNVRSNNRIRMTSRSKDEANDLHIVAKTTKNKHSVVGTENTESSNLHKTQNLNNSESQWNRTNIRTLQRCTSDLSNSKNLPSISKLEFKEIPRFKIFYANVHNRQRGLPKSHILNQLPPTIKGAESLARQIFHLEETQRLPPRVKNVVLLLVKVLRRHRKCNYTALLEYHCPFPTQRIMRARQQKHLMTNIINQTSSQCELVDGDMTQSCRNISDVNRIHDKRRTADEENIHKEFNRSQKSTVNEEPPLKKRKVLKSTSTLNKTLDRLVSTETSSFDDVCLTSSQKNSKQNFTEYSSQKRDTGNDISSDKFSFLHNTSQKQSKIMSWSQQDPRTHNTQLTNETLRLAQQTQPPGWSLSRQTQRRRRWKNVSERPNVSLLPFTPKQLQMKRRMLELSQRTQPLGCSSVTTTQNDHNENFSDGNTQLCQDEMKERNSTPFELSQPQALPLIQHHNPPPLPQESTCLHKELTPIKESVVSSLCSQTLTLTSSTPPPTQTPISPSISISSSFELTQYNTKNTSFNFIRPRRSKVPANRNLERLLTLPTTQTPSTSASTTTTSSSSMSTTTTTTTAHELRTLPPILSSEGQEQQHQQQQEDQSSSSIPSMKLMTQSPSPLRESHPSPSQPLLHTQLNPTFSSLLLSSPPTSSLFTQHSTTSPHNNSTSKSFRLFDDTLCRKRRRRSRENLMHEDEPTEDNNELIEAEEVASDNRHINLKLNESKKTFQSEEDSQKLAEENVDFTLSQATIPELLTFYQEPSQVSAFVCAVVKKLFPLSIWGSLHNFNVVTKYIDLFVKLRRRETFSTKNLLTGFKLNDVEWLKKRPSNSEQQHLPPNDLFKRRQLMHDFLFWLYDSLIISLLRNNFYITETSPHKSRVFYYRRPVWSRIHKLMMLTLTKQHRMLQPIAQDKAEQILKNRRLGYAHIRFLPKTNDLRPILNLKRKGSNPFVKQGKHNSINSILQDAFKILTHEKNTTAAVKFGSSVFSHDEEYRLLVSFKKKLKERSVNGKLPKIYVVSLDITKSYDTIKQQQLFNIVEQIFSKEEYLIQKYTTTELKGRGVVTKLRTCVHDGPFPQFFEFASELATKLKNVILTDNVIYTEPSTADILTLLKQHIFENLVKDGQKYYLQKEGIPQGSVLSSLLCSLYYGYIELNYLADLPLALNKDDNETLALLIRFVDDFLYLTTSLPQAIEFVTRMHRGFPEFGCIVNKNKTLVNFDFEEDGHPLRKCPIDYEGRMYVPWCGWCIDVETLEVQSDFSRYQSVYIGDSLTVEFNHKPGDYLRQKTMNYCEQKLHLILLDFNLNSERTVYINIYNKMILCAIKFCRHAQELPLPIETNLYFFCDVVLDVVKYSFSLIQTKVNSPLSREMQCVCPISQKFVTWLSLKAFQRVLHKKQSRFRAVLRVIEHELKKTETTLQDDEHKFLNCIIQNKNSLCFEHILY